MTVTAAETVIHGGAAALLAASDRTSLRAANAYSLLETSASGGWKRALELERALARRVPLIGVSLTLNTPALGGVLHGYPHDRETVDRIASFPLRGLFGLLPGPVRIGVLRHLPERALVDRSLRGTALGRTLGGAPPRRRVEGRPGSTSRSTRSASESRTRRRTSRARRRTRWRRPTSGLGLALRLWRDAFPVAEGGTAILLSRFKRRFPHPTQQPYRALFQALRSSGARDPVDLAGDEEMAVSDSRAIDTYRASRSCHPLLPFAQWEACQPAIQRLGSVLVAGCRDATVARQLGFVPTHGVGAALTMTHGWADRPPRIGFLLSPPYFPLRVGPG